MINSALPHATNVSGQHQWIDHIICLAKINILLGIWDDNPKDHEKRFDLYIDGGVDLAELFINATNRFKGKSMALQYEWGKPVSHRKIIIEIHQK